MNNYNRKIEELKQVSRRHFLLESAAGLGAAALASFMGSCAPKTSEPSELFSTLDPMAPRPPHFPGKARRVIYLQNGEDSQIHSYPLDLAV